MVIRSIAAAVIIILWLGFTSVVRGQEPPPRDGEIRVAYHELRNITTVWLTLEPKATSGKPVPPMMLLTLSYAFPGKVPKVRPAHADLQLDAGLTWAPQIRLSIEIDDRKAVNLVRGRNGRIDERRPVGFSGECPSRLGCWHRSPAPNASGSMRLGVELELTDSQRAAVGLFLKHILSDNPGSVAR